MALLSASDIAAFRALVDELAFGDSYRLRRPQVAAVDSRGNRRMELATIEEGTCRLRASRHVGGERVIADKLGWISHYSVDLPIDTQATPQDVLVIGERTFEIGEVLREHEQGLVATAICHERSH